MTQQRRKRSAKSCGSLSEVRAEIDRIDRVLLGLIAERGSYVRRAAELKAKRKDVLDPARIAGIVKQVKKRAKTLGLEPNVVAAAFRAMIYRFVAYEFREYDRRNRMAAKPQIRKGYSKKARTGKPRTG